MARKEHRAGVPAARASTPPGRRLRPAVRPRVAGPLLWIGGAVVLAAVLAALLLTGRSTSSPARRPQVGLQVGQIAPDFTLAGLDGKPVSLHSFRGRPVLLHFWAVDCTTCQAEQADYLRAISALGSSAPAIVAVDAWGESASYVKPYVRRHRLPGTVLVDPSRDVFYSTYQGQGTPTAYYLDAHGVIRAEAPGQESYAQIVANARLIVA